MQTNNMYDTPDPGKIRCEYGESGNLISISLVGDIVSDHIHLIRAGVNDRGSLRKFLATDRKWAEMDLRINAVDDSLILRKHSFEKIPPSVRENLFTLEECLDVLFSNNRGARINIHQSGNTLKILKKKLGFYESIGQNIRFNSRIDNLGGHDFMELRETFPGSHIECSIDFMAPIISETPAKAEHILSVLSSWGINSFSLNQDTAGLKRVADYMHATGYKVNINGVNNIEALMDVILLQPSTISCDFDVPGYVPLRQHSK